MAVALDCEVASVDTAVYVHPAALCECRAIGAGTRVWAFAHVLDGAVIGRQCNIGEHAYIEGGSRVGDRVTVKNQVTIWKGVTIEDDVFLGPGVLFTNDRYPRSRRASPESAERYRRDEQWLAATTVRQAASIGAGAIVLAGITIGRFASVGAGAVVTCDIPDHRLAVGNPARLTGWACICGVPLVGRGDLAGGAPAGGSRPLSCPRCERAFRQCGDTLVTAE